MVEQIAHLHVAAFPKGSRLNQAADLRSHLGDHERRRAPGQLYREQDIFGTELDNAHLGWRRGRRLLGFRGATREGCGAEHSDPRHRLPAHRPRDPQQHSALLGKDG